MPAGPRIKEKLKATSLPLLERQEEIMRLLVAPVRRYTRFVIFGKRFLWVLVAAMVVVVIWVAENNTGSDGARIVFSNTPAGDVVENIMLHPHYQGLDAHNQPYTVIAEKATQKDKQTVMLEKVNADMMQHNSRWLALNSATGELNMQSKNMLLSGGVGVFADGGFEMRSDHVRVDIARGNAYGDSPVEGQGPPGTLKADSFSVDGRSHVITFNGSVIMKLYR